MSRSERVEGFLEKEWKSWSLARMIRFYVRECCWREREKSGPGDNPIEDNGGLQPLLGLFLFLVDDSSSEADCLLQRSSRECWAIKWELTESRRRGPKEEEEGKKSIWRFEFLNFEISGSSLSSARARAGAGGGQTKMTSDCWLCWGLISLIAVLISQPFILYLSRGILDRYLY